MRQKKHPKNNVSFFSVCISKTVWKKKLKPEKYDFIFFHFFLLRPKIMIFMFFDLNFFLLLCYFFFFLFDEKFFNIQPKKIKKKCFWNVKSRTFFSFSFLTFGSWITFIFLLLALFSPLSFEASWFVPQGNPSSFSPISWQAWQTKKNDEKIYFKENWNFFLSRWNIQHNWLCNFSNAPCFFPRIPFHFPTFIIISVSILIFQFNLAFSRLFNNIVHPMYVCHEIVSYCCVPWSVSLCLHIVCVVVKIDENFFPFMFVHLQNEE